MTIKPANHIEMVTRTLRLTLALSFLFAGCTDSSDPLSGVAGDAGLSDNIVRTDGGGVGPDQGIHPGNKGQPDPRSCLGYNLIPLEYDGASYKPRVALMDMSGKVVRTWDVFGFPAKAMPGGTIMGLDKSFGGPNTFEGMKIVQRDWNDQTLWSFTSWDKLGDNGLISRQHHDLQREGDPVGYYSPDQTPLAAGRTLVLSHKDVKQPKIASTTIMDDVIYEVDAAGKLTNFTWYASDHVEEMGFDKVARAAMASNPGKSQNDWLHLNSMATLGKNRHYDKTGDERFNPDNIIINSREASFIAIINRATGKIVWRLGPNFKAPWSQKVGPIVAAHHAHMIPKGLPGAGNILVFDNGGAAGYGGANGGYLHERSYTRVLEFDPITLKVVWSYGAASGPEHFICGAQGSAQRLPNGNTLITQADSGRFFEVLPTRETVWEGITRDHFIGLNMPYRVYRVPPEWLPAGVKASGYKAWSNGGCK